MTPSYSPSLRSLIRENLPFFTIFFVYLLACAVLLNIIPQGEAVFFFSERRTPFLNTFFLYATKMGEGIAFLAGMILLLFYRYRSALHLPLAGLAIAIVSNLTKRFFEHQRPSLYFRNLGIFDQITVVEGIHINGGANSFPSGHTMAAFALYTYLALCLPNKRWSGVLLGLLAVLVGVSRVYLVQHFLKDIFFGAMLGVLIGVVFYYLQLAWPRAKVWNRRLGGDSR